jgi:asparagine synthase (glutamine-hydrolysing)
MSGIAGIIRRDGRGLDDALARLDDALARRGFDASGSWRVGGVGLVHRASHATPEARLERQPLADPSRRLVVTADARLDNRAELAPSLDVAPYACDTEFLLAAYAVWGEACPERLVGDFAFAIWDERRRSLFCARDGMGARPLCYHESAGFFAFASDVESLLRLDEIPPTLDEAMIVDYLSANPGDASATFYSAVRRLPPGHCLTVDGSGVRLREYWRLDPGREVRFRRDGEYAEAFREIFFEAVRCRLRSASPIGATLSGGVDSSSVAATARALATETDGRPIHTFTWTFDDLPECDESEYVEAVLSGRGFVAHAVRGDETSPLGDASPFAGGDGPCMGQNIFLWRATYRMARDLGIRVMLDGHDGDSVVSHGDGYLDELARRGRWLALAREVRLGAKRRGRPVLPLLRERATRHLMLPLWRRMREARGRPVTPVVPARAPSIVSPELARRVGPRAFESGSAADAREAHFGLLTSRYLRYATETLDATGAALGVEVRHPFLDRRLVELCLALPSDQKLWRGWGRGVLRRAMDGVLPEKVRWRVGKTRLGAQFDRSFVRDRALLDDVIEKNPDALADYVDLAVLRDAYRRYRANANKEDGVAVWTAVTLGLWLRRAGR